MSQDDRRFSRIRETTAETKNRIATLLGESSVEVRTMLELVQSIDRFNARRVPMHQDARTILDQVRDALAILLEARGAAPGDPKP
jgi:uncharacterized coiled-coil DUF342 family protein